LMWIGFQYEVSECERIVYVMYEHTHLRYHSLG